ncbi:MAG: GlmU family protein [Bacteroidia bacterium]
MEYLLFEDRTHFDLLPFTYTRPLFDLRVGILTGQERWQRVLGAPVAARTLGYLRAHFDRPPQGRDVCWINSKFFPDPDLSYLIGEAAPRTAYLGSRGDLLLARFDPALLPAGHDPDLLSLPGLEVVQTALDPLALRFPEDIFALNAELIRRDFALLTQAISEPLRDPHTRVYGADNLYLAPGARVRAALIDAEDGPVYLGPSSLVSAGAIIQGTHAIGPHATVAMGAKLRGDTTLGPWVKAGGEITNSVIMGYSNKAHDGYLGNAVLGYWCNLGADTNASNLKNTYQPVRLWHEASGSYRDTGRTFCGLMMADHSKCGINTMFNTGTVVGVSANIFGADFPPAFLPSFSWGGAAGLSTYRLDKALETAGRVMSRRQLALSQAEQEVFAAVFARTAAYRTWDSEAGTPP